MKTCNAPTTYLAPYGAIDFDAPLPPTPPVATVLLVAIALVAVNLGLSLARFLSQ